MMMLSVVAVNAQESRGDQAQDSTEEAPVYVVVEKQPQFPGGEGAMMKYISENLNYPPQAREDNIQGRVVVKFIVEADGEVTNVTVVNSAHSALDSAAIAVIENMPNWEPGTQRGKPVRVQFVLPIRFVLDGDVPKKKRRR